MNNKHPLWQGHGEISKHTWNMVKRCAFRRKILFEISIEDAWKLFLDQDRKCNLSGVNIDFGKKSHDYKNQTASLDRIDSTKGYVKGNVQWVHKDVNRMKQCFDQEYFIELCKLIYNHKKPDIKGILERQS